jgi:hypothetical protein
MSLNTSMLTEKTMFASIQDGGRRLLILNIVLLGK